MSFNAQSTAEHVARAFAEQIHSKTVLITGVTKEGLGFETARVLALNGVGNLVLAGRSQSKLDETESALKHIAPSVGIKKVILDLNSLKSVRKAAGEIKDPIDVLINNAGFAAPKYAETEDGFESSFGVNHLGHFLFTSLMLPRILAGRDRRIVNISSAAHAFSEIRFDDLDFDKGKAWDKFPAYAQSKTANILFSLSLADKFHKQGITSFSVHPGAVDTSGARAMYVSDRERLQKLGILDAEGKPVAGVVKSLEQGAATSVFAAFDPSIAKQSGGYLVDCQVANDQAAPFALDKSNAERLWTLSEHLVQENF